VGDEADEAVGEGVALYFFEEGAVFVGRGVNPGCEACCCCRVKEVRCEEEELDW